MAKFVMECPNCGKYVQARTSFFARKKINCACGYTVDVKLDKLASRTCPHCGNDVVFDQSKGEGRFARFAVIRSTPRLSRTRWQSFHDNVRREECNLRLSPDKKTAENEGTSSLLSCLNSVTFSIPRPSDPQDQEDYHGDDQESGANPEGTRISCGSCNAGACDVAKHISDIKTDIVGTDGDAFFGAIHHLNTLSLQGRLFGTLSEGKEHRGCQHDCQRSSDSNEGSPHGCAQEGRDQDRRQTFAVHDLARHRFQNHHGNGIYCKEESDVFDISLFCQQSNERRNKAGGKGKGNDEYGIGERFCIDKGTNG